MDDSRVAAVSEKEAWRAYQRVGSIWKYLGLQGAPRKGRMDGQDGGPWRGTKFHIINGSIYQLIGEVKWAKTQPMI